MISIAKAFSAEYYVSDGGATSTPASGDVIAQAAASAAAVIAGKGMESYYLDAVAGGEPPGQWAGSGAQRLHLAGEVGARDMETLYGEFIDPRTGTPVGRRADKHRTVEDRMGEALAAEPDALPERVEQIRTRIERTDRQAVIGWDVTFSVPKSVTVAHTAAHRAELAADRAGDSERAERFRSIREGIESAIFEARDSTIAYAETLATARTGGSQGVPTRWVPATGLTAATFFQHTSRSIDPQLHVHMVILNRAFCADGKIRALDGADLLAQKHALGAISDRTLDEALTRMGFEVQLRPDMKARELTVIPTEINDLFSTRTRQVTTRVAELAAVAEERLGRELTDHELYRLKDAAAASTRASKKGPKDHAGETRAELLERWWAETVAEVGRDLDSVADAIDAHLTDRAGTSGEVVPYSEQAIAVEAVAAVGEQKSAWTRADLMLELQLRLPSLGGLSGPEVRQRLNGLADRALASDLAQQVSGLDDLATHPHHAASTDDADRADTDGADGVGGPLASLRVDPFTRPSSHLYASTGTLLAEGALRRAGIERGGHQLDAAAVGAWLDTYASSTGMGLGPDQRAAVVGLATTDARLAVLIGPAGTGKSYTAGTFAALWGDLSRTSNGLGSGDGMGSGRVIGLATSTVAANVLRNDGVVHTPRNISTWLGIQDRLTGGSTHPEHQAWKLGPADVVLVDEASMIATKDLHRIHGLVETAGARMVLTGDPRQLGAVEAGGVVELLDGHAHTFTLSDVRRFQTGWEAAASLALRDGDRDALTVYDRHGRFTGYDTATDALDAAARAAVADRLDGRSVVVVAGTNDEAAHIAGRIRTQLVALGLVEESGVLLGRDGGTAGIGDVVMCRHNDYTIGVTNRAQYLVTGTGPDGSLTVRPLDREAPIDSSAPEPGTETVPENQARVDGSPILVPGGHVRTDFQLGYASTVHAAQGITVDAAHVVTDGSLDAGGLYVALTRGRSRNTAHVITTPPAGDLHEATGGALTRPSPRAVLEGCLERDSSSRAATVERERDLELMASMTRLSPRLQATVSAACTERMFRHLDELLDSGDLTPTARAALSDSDAPGVEALSQLLRAVEQAGRDPRNELRAAVTAPRGLADADAIAQVLHHRITAGQPLPHPLAADTITAPGDIAPAAVDHITLIAKRIETRRDTLAAEIAEQQPAWALDALGPLPEDREGQGVQAARGDWLRRAGLIAAHREATGWDSPDRAIGPMPGMTHTERRATYAAAWQALGQPATGLDDAALSEGQLRIRARARQVELAWAPPHADAALRAAELAAETARQNATITRAEAEHAAQAGDHDRASQLLAEAAGHEQAHAERAASAAALDRAATARAQWAASAAPTLDAGERAHAEAERRGLDLTTYTGQADQTDDGPSGRVPAEEWFAAETHARAADDAHRPITETDIATDDDTPADETADAASAAGPEAGAAHDVKPPAEAWGGHAVIPEDISSGELEAMTAATALVTARLADRASQDSHDSRLDHGDPGDAAAAGETYEAGRRRRDAADTRLDQASTSQDEAGSSEEAWGDSDA